MPQESSHPNSGHHEDLGYVAFSPDPLVYTANVTEHIPVHWQHRAQVWVATAAGAKFDVLLGPSPDGGLRGFHKRLDRSFRNISDSEIAVFNLSFIIRIGGHSLGARIGRIFANNARITRIIRRLAFATTHEYE
jgi:hypothetical protein